MGDSYIKRAAEAIKSSVRSEEVVARIGGDEFAIILPGTDYAKADDVFERFLEKVEEESKARELPLSLTIGLSFETIDGNNHNPSIKNIRKYYNIAYQRIYEQKFTGSYLNMRV